MSSTHSIIQYLLAADGTNQLQRNAKALASGYVRMDERNERELLEFIEAVAEQIRFYEINNVSSGDWKPFLTHFRNGNTILALNALKELENRNDWPAHAALIWAFLKIYGIAQSDMNALTDAHLLYYYSDVLKLPQKPPTPDQVHVIFTAAKNAQPSILTAGSLLDAGKFEDGTLRQYALDHDIVINQAIVDRVLSTYTDRDKSGRQIIFKSTDAMRILSGTGGAWRPFGASQLTTSVEQRGMDAASVGFAIASPALLLAEGTRTITLTMQLAKDPAPPEIALSSVFDIDLTGEEGWLKPDTLTAQINSESKLVITARISETLPPLVQHHAELHESPHETQWPLMRCMIKPQAYVLELMDTLSCTSVEISVNVTGVKNLILQNDQAVQLPDKPILPFTSQPLIGSSFYIGSPEVFHKSLTSLSVHLDWQDPPPDFAEHYDAYGLTVAITNTNTFGTIMSLRAGRNWNTKLIGGGRQALFNSNTSTRRTIAIQPVDFANDISTSGFLRRPEAPAFTEFSNKLNQGFIKLELIDPTRADMLNQPPDAPFEAFGHKSFATVYARQVIALAQFSGGGTPPELPKPPYTPTLKAVTLDYSAKEIFYPSNPNYIDEFFIEDVFGPHKLNRNEKPRIIPEIPGNGALYIGLKNASAPQAVSMLFQIEEGSSTGDALVSEEDLQWSYLSSEEWNSIEPHEVLEDSTKELQQPGLIRLNLGQTAVQYETRMPQGLHWLRLVANQRANGASSIVALNAQAARATLRSGSGQILPVRQQLPESTITGLVQRRGAIKKVEQPYPSFGGQPPELLQAYSRRASERIRHRNRAITTWDYERLVLNQFPDIFKVRCIPYTDAENSLVPGDIHLVVVPDWSKRKSGSPLQPAANAAFLREIADYLNEECVTPFTGLHVTNPAFETLLIDTRVAFHPGFDPGYYSQQLDEELKRFLSPWAYDEGHDIQFGGRVYRSEILAFVEGRHYVDYVIDFQLYHRHTSGVIGGIGQMVIEEDFVIGTTPVPTVNGATINLDFIVGEPVDIAVATRPDTILVSNAYHRINVLESDHFCAGVLQTGIGQMIVGIDFVPIS